MLELFRVNKAWCYVALAALTVALLALAVGYGLNRSPPAQPLIAAVPEKTMDRKIVMRPESTGEYLRILHLKDDLRTVDHAEVWFRDGGIGHIDFRDDGTVSAYSAHYKFPDGSTQLKVEGAFLPDGATLRYENRFREDGTASMRGKRIAGSGYEVKRFFEDGIELASDELFDQFQEVLKGTHWFKGGAVKKTIHRDELNARVTNEFRENGTKLNYHWVLYSREKWVAYQEDGATPITSFEVVASGNKAGTSYHVQALYYNPDGSLHHEREFGNSYMKVIFRDLDGDIIFTQHWIAKEQVTELAHLDPENFYLGMIVLGGKSLVGNDAFFLYENGVVEKSMFQVEVEGDDKLRYLIKEYDEDGSLLEVSEPQMVEGKVKSVTTSFDEDPARQKFDPGLLKPEWIEIYPFTSPPKVAPQNIAGVT